MSAHAEAAKLALDALASGEVTLLDKLHAPDYVDHTPLPGQSSGPAGLRERAMVLSAAFFDTSVTAQVLVDHGDTVVLQACARGVHKGPFFGVAATGRQIEAVGICVFRFVDGLIAQTWSSFDFGGLLGSLRHEPVVPQARGTVTPLAATR
jgi:predicted ester cyclase